MNLKKPENKHLANISPNDYTHKTASVQLATSILGLTEADSQASFITPLT